MTQRRFSEDTLELIDSERTVRSGGERGAWELRRRLKEMDRQGVVAEVLLPGHQESVLPFFDHTSPPSPPDHRAAGARAYNRQLADVIAESDARLVGVADAGPCLDMDETVRELHRVAGSGFVAVPPPRNIADPTLPALRPVLRAVLAGVRRDEPCPQRARRVRVPPGLGRGYEHDGLDGRRGCHRRPAQHVDAFEQRAFFHEHRPVPEGPRLRTALTEPRRVMWQLMLAGVLRSLPHFAACLHRDPSRLGPRDARVARAPLRQAATHPFGARPGSTGNATCGRAVVHPSVRGRAAPRCGLHRFMFGTDYPHPEGTWPNTREWIRDAFAGVPLNEARLILGLNAVRCYGLDGEALRKVADNVGPAPRGARRSPGRRPPP